MQRLHRLSPLPLRERAGMRGLPAKLLLPQDLYLDLMEARVAGVRRVRCSCRGLDPCDLLRRSCRGRTPSHERNRSPRLSSLNELVAQIFPSAAPWRFLAPAGEVERSADEACLLDLLDKLHHVADGLRGAARRDDRPPRAASQSPLAGSRPPQPPRPERTDDTPFQAARDAQQAGHEVEEVLLPDDLRRSGLLALHRAKLRRMRRLRSLLRRGDRQIPARPIPPWT